MIDEFQPPRSNASPLPAADVQAHDVGPVEYEAFPVRKPEADLNDFKIQMRASTLVRCRTQLSKIAKPSFSWGELALAVSTLAGGAAIGALAATIEPKTFEFFFFFSVLPALSLAGFVAYFFLRRSATHDASAIANGVLEELPDPDKTR